MSPVSTGRRRGRAPKSVAMPNQAETEHAAVLEEDKETKEGPKMANRKALIVAINDYGGPPNNLPSCINDGNAFQRILQAKYNFLEVHTLYDAKATVTNVEKELDWLVKDVKSDDRIVFYFSGHGYTKLVNGIMQEFLVLRDDAGKIALWVDDKLVAKTREVPFGTLTVICDSCFSGGMFKIVFDASEPAEAPEVAQVKAYQPSPEEATKAFEPLVAKPEEVPIRVAGYRRFGCGTSSVLRAVARASARVASAVGTTRGTTTTKALSDASEAAQPELNGLLVSACLETETAAASTSKTEGLSAFTHSLVSTLNILGTRRSAAEVFQATANGLKQLGFRQTPLILERAAPGNLKNRTFIGLEVAKATVDGMAEKALGLETAGVAEEDMEKFLPLLGAILPAVISAAPGLIRAVRGRRKELSLGEDAAVSEEEMEKFLPLLGAILPAVISAAPGLVSALRGRRKELALAEDAAISEEEMEKFLPLLGALLPAVISAAPGLISAVRGRGRRKDLDVGGEDEATAIAEEDVQKFLPLLGVLLPAVISAAPGLIRSVRGRRKEFELADVPAETDVADEKIFGAVMRILPQVLPLVLRATPGIAQAIAGSRKDLALGIGTGEGAEIPDEKIFGAILRVLPQVLRAAPGIVQAVTGRRKELDLDGADIGEPTEIADEKIFGAILRVLPQVLRAAPGIVEALGRARQKEMDLTVAETIEDVDGSDAKIFGVVRRILPRVLQTAPEIARLIASAQRQHRAA